MQESHDMTIGSFFDGIGGSLLAAQHAGITPVWASEIEAFPCSVTKKHFPNVMHMGDITKINPDTLPPVVHAFCIVRRLTPTECERLQGLEDGYTEGGSDTARYKALGNGMAQPCIDYVIRRITECAGCTH